MKLQAKSRLLAFSPTGELTDVVRKDLAQKLKALGLKVEPQYRTDDVYPTVLYFEFESGSWSLTLGEVSKGTAELFVTTPIEATNNALRLFTRSKDWSGVEAVNAQVSRCLKVLKKTGIEFYLENPNVVHKLVSIAGVYKIPKELK